MYTKFLLLQLTQAKIQSHAARESQQGAPLRKSPCREHIEANPESHWGFVSLTRVKTRRHAFQGEPAAVFQ